MSMDYPLYEEMIRRKSRGRWFWRIGDWLYYIGLLIFLSSPIFIGMVVYVKLTKTGKGSPLAAGALWALFGACVFLLGGWLKNLSYSIAEKEGIDVRKY